MGEGGRRWQSEAVAFAEPLKKRLLMPRERDPEGRHQPGESKPLRHHLTSPNAEERRSQCVGKPPPLRGGRAYGVAPHEPQHAPPPKWYASSDDAAGEHPYLRPNASRLAASPPPLPPAPPSAPLPPATERRDDRPPTRDPSADAPPHHPPSAAAPCPTGSDCRLHPAAPSPPRGESQSPESSSSHKRRPRALHTPRLAEADSAPRLAERAPWRGEQAKPCSPFFERAEEEVNGTACKTVAEEEVNGTACRTVAEEERNGIAFRSVAEEKVNGTACRAVAEEEMNGIAFSSVAEGKINGTACRTVAEEEVNGTACKAVAEEKVNGTACKAVAEEKVNGTALHAVAEEKVNGTACRAVVEEERNGIAFGSVAEEKVNGTAFGSVEEEKVNGTACGAVVEEERNGIAFGSVAEEKVNGTAFGSVEEEKVNGATCGAVEEGKVNGTACGAVEEEERSAAASGAMSQKNAHKPPRATGSVATDANLKAELRQCDACGKWRRLAAAAGGGAIDSDARWYCHMHPEPRFQSCRTPQERVVFEAAQRRKAQSRTCAAAEAGRAPRGKARDRPAKAVRRAEPSDGGVTDTSSEEESLLLKRARKERLAAEAKARVGKAKSCSPASSRAATPTDEFEAAKGGAPRRRAKEAKGKELSSVAVRLGGERHVSSSKRSKLADGSPRDVSPPRAKAAAAKATPSDKPAEWDDGLEGECARTMGWPLVESYRKKRRERSHVRGGALITSSIICPSFKGGGEQSASGSAGGTTSSRGSRREHRAFASTMGLYNNVGDALLFNELKWRKKKLIFGKSAIHAWGLYAAEPIEPEEFVVEYLGEYVRSTLADARQRNYEGYCDDYIFRVDDDLFVDATNKGGLARFANHCCDGNCYSRIITAGGMKRIVLYSKERIEVGEEITYDYKFELETDPSKRIPCSCGSAKCTGYLN